MNAQICCQPSCEIRTDAIAAGCREVDQDTYYQKHVQSGPSQIVRCGGFSQDEMQRCSGALVTGIQDELIA